MGRATRRRPAPRDTFETSWLRTGLRWLVTAKLVGIVLLLDPRALQSFDLPKTVFSHAVTWPIATLLLLAIWSYGRRIFPSSPLHIAVAATGTVWVVSTIFAADQYLAVFGDPFRYEGLTYLADMIILYAAVAVAFRETRDFVLPGVGLAAGLAVALVYAFIQRLGSDPIAWATDPLQRPFSVFGNADIFGQFLSVAFGVVTGVAIFAASERAVAVRFVASAFVIAIIVTAAVVATRGTLLGMAAVVATCPFVIVRVRGVSRPVLKPIVGGALLAGVIGAALLLVTPLGSRVSATIFEGAGLQARVVIYESAIAAVRDRPLLGWGPNNFAAAYPHYRTTNYAGSPGNQPDSSAHNWVLESAVTTGVLGALGSLALAGVAAQRLFNRGLDRMPMIAGPILLGLIGYWVHGLVSVESLGVDWFGWAALGVAASITGRPHDVSVRRRLEPVAAVASVALACIVATTGWTSIAASHMALQAKRETAARHADPAISAATNATKADSARSQYWEVLGHAYGLKEQWRDAGDAFAEAVRRAPYIASNYANLARSRARQAFAGDQSARASALDAARRGARLDPNNWEAESVLAEIQSAFGEPEEALTTLALAVSLNPRNSTNDIVASEAATRVSDPQRARALIERILERKETALLRVTLAKVALRLSDRDLALTNARRAIELEPGNADALKVVSSLGG